MSNEKGGLARLGITALIASLILVSLMGASTDDFSSRRPAQLADAYQRASQAWDALSTPPVRSETAITLLREALHLLRGPSAAGYRFADLLPPERKPGQTGDLWVTLDSLRVNHLYESAIGDYKASGTDAAWVRVYLPSRRNPTRKNGDAYLESITIAYRLGESFKASLTETPRKWLRAGEDYVVFLPHPADAVEVTARMATREADLDKTLAKIETRPATVRDHEQADDFYLIVLARSAIDALKSNNLSLGRAYTRSLYEILSARTGKTVRS
ncbi:MAG: hypothetical protein V2G44_01435 [bacterium JZ-2024 1]